MIDLRKKTELGARALECTILSAARSEETLAAEWSEIEPTACDPHLGASF
jgi:hypothetical protein